MAMTGFPFSMGTMLWKTVCALRRIVAWRGLQHGACKSGSGRKIFGFATNGVTSEEKKRLLV
jgi:hypothetical protein